MKDGFERRLAMLRTEVNLDFPGLLPSLEKGIQVVTITDPIANSELAPDFLRRLGGMVMLCKHYGAAVVFVDEPKLVEVNSSNRAEA